MRLTKIFYSEFSGSPNHWTLADADFGRISLVVGKNASGKTRLTHVITGLAQLLSSQRRELFTDGEYKVELTDETQILQYEITFKNGLVTHERLFKDGWALLDRNESGQGRIWAQKQNDWMEFESPPSVVAANVRRQKRNHDHHRGNHSDRLPGKTFFP